MERGLEDGWARYFISKGIIPYLSEKFYLFLPSWCGSQYTEEKVVLSAEIFSYIDKNYGKETIKKGFAQLLTSKGKDKRIEVKECKEVFYKLTKDETLLQMFEKLEEKEI
jgi:hypothetical protein